MSKFKNLAKLAALLMLAVFLLTFVSCEKQDPVSSLMNDEPALSSGATGQALFENGPLSAEELAAITAPDEKIQVAEFDLKILKSKNGASLEKRFISIWNVPLGAYGWAYTGDSEHGRCYLYFPPNALNEATTITMDWESTGFLEGGAEFSPHGIQFNNPVTVWISYKDADLQGISEEDLKIWYFNEDTSMWELIGDTVNTESKMVGGLLNHFSRYAIGME